jgi:hypothetical protein
MTVVKGWGNFSGWGERYIQYLPELLNLGDDEGGLVITQGLGWLRVWLTFNLSPKYYVIEQEVGWMN